MKDQGLDMGLIRTAETSDRRNKGNFWGFRKMFWAYLNKLHVTFYDPCCPGANGSTEDLEFGPVRYNATGDIIERYNGSAWVEAAIGDFTAEEVVTDLISEQTAAAGVTIDGVLLKDGGITVDATGISGATGLAAFYPDAVQDNIAAAAGGAISVANYLTTINTDAGGDAFTLANGTQTGQMKKILLVTDGGGDGVVTPATAFAGGATTATFNDAADYLILMWNGTAWRVLENSGVTVA